MLMEHERKETGRREGKPQSRPAKSGGKERNRRSSPAAQIAQQRREERKRESTEKRRLAASEPRKRTGEKPVRSRERPTAERRTPRPAPAASPKAAPRPKRVTKQRNSIGAQTARQHRQERKERARLEDTRQRQKKQAKQRTRRRISPDTWKRILIMGAVVAAVVLSMVIFFRVENVLVTGNHYYSADEIKDAANISQGDNLLTLSRGQIAGNVIARLPYVKNVRVTRQLPDSVVIRVTEYEATYAIQDSTGAYYLITAGGKVTEPITEREAKGHILVQEITINPPTVGEILTLKVPEGKEAEAETWRNALLNLLQEIESAELTKDVASVSVPSAYQLSLWYGDRFNVRLGNSDRLAYKLEFLKVVVAEQKDYVSGSIDLSLNEGNEAHVLKDE